MQLALLGGIFAILTFIHFVSDWVFQSHDEAMIKHQDWLIRAKHCLFYTACFYPFFWMMKFNWIEYLISINILFWSHVIEDTYIPVFLWAKYIRKPSEMTNPLKVVQPDGYISVVAPNSMLGFKEFANTSLGKILCITIDQLIHLLFLIPIAWITLHHLQ